MITVKLKTKLIDRSRIFRGKKHDYLDLVLIENKNGVDEFGYHGICKQGVSAQERADGVEMPIIGNFTIYERKASVSSPVVPERDVTGEVEPF